MSSSMIPHTFTPRSMMNMEEWTKPCTMWFDNDFAKKFSTLEMFDAFDALDHTMGSNMMWLKKPDWMLTPMMPQVPQKYRITLDCTGFSPKSIKCEWKGNVLTVTGMECWKCPTTGDFNTKEFKKTFTMPPQAECDKWVSFWTADYMLCIEVPLKETEKHSNMDLFPQICDAGCGAKCVKMKFMIPECIKPEDVCISIKDRCLMFKAEEKKTEMPGGMCTTFHWFKMTTLPENTAWEGLKCTMDNNCTISVSAPLNLEWKPTMTMIPFEKKWMPMHKEWTMKQVMDKECCNKKICA